MSYVGRHNGKFEPNCSGDRFLPPLSSGRIYTELTRTALDRTDGHAVSKLPPGARKKQKKRGKKKGGNGQGNANKGLSFENSTMIE